MLSAGHGEETSTQEEDGCLFHEFGERALSSARAKAIINISFFKKKSVIKNITQLSVLKQCVLMRAPQVV